MDGDEIVAVNVQSGGRDTIQAILLPDGTARDNSCLPNHDTVDECLVRVIDDSKVKP